MQSILRISFLFNFSFSRSNKNWFFSRKKFWNLKKNLISNKRTYPTLEKKAIYNNGEVLYFSWKKHLKKVNIFKHFIFACKIIHLNIQKWLESFTRKKNQLIKVNCKRTLFSNGLHFLHYESLKIECLNFIFSLIQIFSNSFNFNVWIFDLIY